MAWDEGSFWLDEGARQVLTRVDESVYVSPQLNPLVTYRFSVRPINDCGNGPFSEDAFIYVP